MLNKQQVTGVGRPEADGPVSTKSARRMPGTRPHLSDLHDTGTACPSIHGVGRRSCNGLVWGAPSAADAGQRLAQRRHSTCVAVRHNDLHSRVAIVTRQILFGSPPEEARNTVFMAFPVDAQDRLHGTVPLTHSQ